MLRSNGRPPLARSPVRLRSRRNPLSDRNSTPPGSLTKSQTRRSEVEKSELRPEFHTISSELRALAEMLGPEPGNAGGNLAEFGSRSCGVPLFERGRFYEEYSARRNERLKRKKCEMEGYGSACKEKKASYDLGVRVESTKKKPGRKIAAVATTPVAERREAPTPRYLLRSSVSKENKKPAPPLPINMNIEKSLGITARKTATRSSRKA